MKRSVQLWSVFLILVAGAAGCGAKSDVPPVEYGEQVLNAKATKGPPKHIVPAGMEPAESVTSNPSQ